MAQTFYVVCTRPSEKSPRLEKSGSRIFLSAEEAERRGSGAVQELVALTVQEFQELIQNQKERS